MQSVHMNKDAQLWMRAEYVPKCCRRWILLLLSLSEVRVLSHHVLLGLDHTQKSPLGNWGSAIWLKNILRPSLSSCLCESLVALHLGPNLQCTLLGRKGSAPSSCVLAHPREYISFLMYLGISDLLNIRNVCVWSLSVALLAWNSFTILW